MIFLHENVVYIVQILQNPENYASIFVLILKFDILWDVFSQLLVQFMELLYDLHSLIIFNINSIF